MTARDLVPLAAAAGWIPHAVEPDPPSPARLARWVETGDRGVRLRAVRVGGKWFTCRAWVEAFLMVRE